jgi:hypothetical protein
MDYWKQQKKTNQKILEILDIFNKKKVEGTFTIQVDNLKYVKKTDFKITCASVSLLYYEMTDAWKEYVIDIEKEVTEDKEIVWKWKLNEKGEKIYRKISKEMSLK